MNPKDRHPMSHDDELRAVLRDAVSDVAPRDRLAEIRRRTRTRGRGSARRWAPVLLGAGAVLATVVAATVLVRGLDGGTTPDEDDPVAADSTTAPTTRAAGIYYLSGSPDDTRLYREFQVLPATSDDGEAVHQALERLSVDRGPDDPDYRTAWPSGSFAGVRVEPDLVTVELGTELALDRPSGVARGDQLLGVQQAVYTANAALGETLPLAFEWQGEPAGRVLGREVKPLVERNSQHDVTAPVNISDPAEGLAVEDSLVARGTMARNVDSAVQWQITQNGLVVRGGSAPPVDVDAPDAGATLGSPGWETEIDLTEIEAGDYLFTAMVTTTGQTSDSPDEHTDTRNFTVR